jgi:hypothetical protein
LDVVYNHAAEGNQRWQTLSFKGLDNASYYRLLPDNPRYYINDTGTGNTLNVSHPRGKNVATTGGDASGGMAALSKYGFSACQTIPGIRGAHGLVGPSLSRFGSRMYIAGMLTNEPGNLTRWVRDPKSVNEGL